MEDGKVSAATANQSGFLKCQAPRVGEDTTPVMKKAKEENLFWAFFYNIIGIPLAAGLWYPVFGWKLNPMFGAKNDKDNAY